MEYIVIDRDNNLICQPIDDNDTRFISKKNIYVSLDMLHIHILRYVAHSCFEFEAYIALDVLRNCIATRIALFGNILVFQTRSKMAL